MAHPDWLLISGIIFVIAFVAFVLTHESNRKRALIAAAAEMGFARIDADDIKVHELPFFEHHFNVELALEGTAGGYLCTILEVRIPKGKYSEYFTVIAYTSESLNMPMFQAHAHTWTDNIAGIFKSEVVRFPDSPSFDESVSVRSPDAEQIRAFLTPDLQSYLISACASYTVEAHIGTVAFYSHRKRVGAAELRTFVDATSSIAQGLLALVPKTMHY